ncbi:hypothetical protein [Adlercreutzia caecimuris]|jgi:hypothetical protein|uniref:hypothetical protein n=1 Tax=Adlercreutzia caecimuris TaxID=671266 RepID=UPI0025AFC51A|nr:hypothetical protein [Adlercreutzia caecimuris]
MLKCENVDCDIPKTFYVFVGHADDLGGIVNANNYAIAHRLVVAGASRFFDEDDRSAYLNGTIDYRVFAEGSDNCAGSKSAVRPSIGQLSSFALAHWGDAAENRLEEVGREMRLKCPSRLASLFAFGE